MTFLVWLILTGVLKPGFGLPVHSPNGPGWLTALSSHPCDTPIYERFSNALPGPPLLSWQGLLVLIWAATAIALCFRQLQRRSHFRKVVKASKPVANPCLHECLEHWQKQWGLGREVSLLKTSEVTCAFTMGLHRPVIILPESLLNKLSHADLEAVILHELAHVRRLDDLWLRLQQIAQSLFFFCPSTWFLGRRLYQLREHCCDLLAANTLGAKRYGSALLNVAKIQSSRRDPSPDLALTGKHNFLEQRIRTLVHPPGNSSSWLPVVVTITVLTLLSLLTAFRPVSADILPRSESLRILDELRPVSPLQSSFIAKGFQGGDTASCWLPIAANYPHPALDLQSGEPTQVRAVAEGVVQSAVRGIGSYTGMIIIVRHANNVFSSYAHLDSSDVQKGDTVSQGQAIGDLPGGQNLHFEMYRGSKKVDLSSMERIVRETAQKAQLSTPYWLQRSH